MRLGMRRRRIHARRASRQCSLAVEHPLSKREVVGSNPAIGFLVQRDLWGTKQRGVSSRRSALPASICRASAADSFV